jgi:chromosome segregation ATPase
MGLLGVNDFANGEPNMGDLERLHKHIGSRISEAPRGRYAPAARPKDGRDVLELIEEAAELFTKREDQAREFETRARAAAQGAIEKLQSAEDTIRVLMDDNSAAEARIAQLSQKLHELAEALKVERARVVAAESQLPRLEMRARTAEAMAEECEKTLSRIEETIRTKLLRERPSGHHRAAAA